MGLPAVLLVLLLVWCNLGAATVGLSIDTSTLLAQTYVPTGNTALLQPLPTGDGWTVEMWIKYDPTVSRIHMLYAQLPVNACAVFNFDNYGFAIATLPDNNVQVNVQWCSGALTLQTTTPLVVGQWQHLSVVFKELQGIFIYYNGKIIRSSLDVLPDTDPNLLAFTWDTTTPFANAAHLVLWDDTGLIDELRFWNVALSHSSVSSKYCKRLSATGTPNLVALWNFDSNLGPDHSTRVFLNTTFDLGKGANNIIYSPPLLPTQLVQEETGHWCGSKDTTNVIIIIAVIGSLLCLIVLLWLLATAVIRYRRNSSSSAQAGRRRVGLGGDI